MRHTYATLGLAAGATLDWISEQIGHSDIRATKRFYARYTRPVHDRNVALLNEFAASSADVASHPRHDEGAAR
jgi:integrase